MDTHNAELINEVNLLSADELQGLRGLYAELLRNTREVAEPADAADLRHAIAKAVAAGHYGRDKFGNSLFVRALLTANALCSRVSADRNMV